MASPTETKETVRSFLRSLLGLILRIFFPRIEISNIGRVPARGPVILVVNHPNGLIDPLFLLCLSPRPCWRSDKIQAKERKTAAGFSWEKLRHLHRAARPVRIQSCTKTNHRGFLTWVNARCAMQRDFVLSSVFW